MWFHFRAGDQSGQKVVGKDSFGTFFAAIHGEGNALIQEREIGGMLASPDFVCRQRGKHLQQRGVMRTRFTRVFKRLVVRGIDEIVAQNRVIKAANLRQTHGEV